MRSLHRLHRPLTRRTALAAGALHQRRWYARIAPDGSRVYDRSEVALHNHDEDLWIVIDNKVYDVTNWAAVHPGGRGVIENHAGADATDAWSKVGHSEWAQTEMEKYRIGTVEDKQRFTGMDWRVEDD